MVVTPFQKEAWSEYGIGTAILFLRIFARCWTVGLNWDGDDYLAVLSVLFWTAECIMLELIGQYGSITGMTNAIAVTLSEDEVRSLVIGSKCLLAGWILYTTLIWCLKGCMLFFLNRLTLNLKQQQAVKITAGVCIAGYIACIVVFLTHCHPIYKLWQVYPYPGDGCALNIPKYLALVVTNVVTDIIIVSIPISLLWRVKIPLQRKIVYGLWLCTGMFIMVATLLRCILCLNDATDINVGTIWSIRETFVGIIAVNAPILQPFFIKAIRSASSAVGLSWKQTEDSYHPGTHQLTRIERREKQNRIRQAMGLTTLGNGTIIEENESKERIVPDFDPNAKNNGVAVSAGSDCSERLDRDPYEIMVTRAYGVSDKHV